MTSEHVFWDRSCWEGGGPGEIAFYSQRKLGEHAAKIEDLREEMRALRADTAEIKDILAEVRGRWKMMLMFGAAMSAMGAAAAKVISLQSFIPR